MVVYTLPFFLEVTKKISYYMVMTKTTSEQIKFLERKYQDSDLPKVSIIIPSFNNSKLLGQTLESILRQEYPTFEIILVDASSTDKTLEVVKNLRENRLRVYSVTSYRPYEMLNLGISHAAGEYVCALFPGDSYTYIHTLRFMMSLALEENKPDLVFCGTLLRDGRSEIKTLYRELSLKLLKQGNQPTSMQSCWMRLDTLKELGKLDPQLQLRGGFDLLCRFILSKKYRVASAHRFYTDYDIRSITSQMLITHFFETMRVVWRHFGFLATVSWLFQQKDTTRFLKHWGRKWKLALFGR